MWLYEEKLQEELDRNNDVRKKGMSGFYSNLLTKNISVGGDISSATSSYTTGGHRNDRLIDENNVELLQEDRETKRLKQDTSISINLKVIDNSEITIKNDEIIQQLEESIEGIPIVDVIKKEDVVLSARERYLQRKQNKINQK